MPDPAIGFIGLGVMGEPMCRHLALKSGRRVLGFDVADAALLRLAGHGVERAATLTEIAQRCDTIFLALPSGAHVEAVCRSVDGLLAQAGPQHLVVDLGTSPVAVEKSLASAFAERQATFCDAPIARTRQAAEDGALSIMVGADKGTFEKIHPLLRCFATDVTHCGPAGSGQVVKLMNNMVLVETVIALAEALAVGRAAGVDGRVLFETLAKGSADSFALRNHGMKAMLPAVFPERAFSTRYALKDIEYALALAHENGITIAGAARARDVLEAAIARGDGDAYWPIVANGVAMKEGRDR